MRQWLVGRRVFGAGCLASGVAGAMTVSVSRATFAQGRRGRMASGTTLTLTVDPTQVFVGASFTLTLAVEHEGQGALPEPELPAVLLDAAAFELAGPSQQSGTYTQFIGGVVSMRRSLTQVYEVTPRRPGTFSLRAEVRTPTGVVASNEVAVEVKGSAAKPEASPEAAASGGNKPAEARGDLFAWAYLDKPRVYVGEQVTYALEIYERTSFVGIHLRSAPSFRDFWSEELGEVEARIEQVGAVPYRVHTGLRRALFPQQTGTLRVGGAELGVGLRKRLVVPEAVVEVLPLPAEGQPKGFFANNVGSYALSAEVDRTQANVGQPLTLRVVLSGEGNLKLVDPGPWPAIAGVRAYDPKVETTLEARGDKGPTAPVMAGKRTYTFLLIPEVPGTLEIPAYVFWFFDPKAKAYRKAETRPISIPVGGQGPAGAGTVGGSGTPQAAGAAKPETTSAGAGPAKDAEADVERWAPLRRSDAIDRRAAPRPWWTLAQWTQAMVGAPLAFGLAAGVSAVLRRLAPDDRAREAAAAAERHRELMAKAKADLEGGESFFTHIGTLLQEAAVRRAGPDAKGLVRSVLRDRLEKQGVDAATVGLLGELLDRCDQARFAGDRGTRDHREEILRRAQTVCDALLRGRGRKGGPTGSNTGASRHTT